MTLTECKEFMRLYQRGAEGERFNWRTTARWALRHKWAQEENGKLRDELRRATGRAEQAEAALNDLRTEFALAQVALAVAGTTYTVNRGVGEALAMAEIGEDAYACDECEGVKDVIRSAPGLPVGYMAVRHDYLTELHRDRAQAMAKYRRLNEKYVSAARELHYFQQERQQGVVGLRRIEGTLPADDLRRAFADGAAWWEFHSQGFTMFNSDRREAEAEAEARFPNGKPGPVEVRT